MSRKKILAVILGGGQGSRLQPLTSKRSKPAVPIAGKYRLVDIPISNCLNSKINKIFVLTQFNSASLNHHIKNSYTFDLFSKGFVNILAAEQTVENTNWFQGTADAVRQSYPHFEKIGYDYLLILSGDQLYHMNFKQMLKKHIKQNADLSIATIPVTSKDATGFGIMKTNEENRITSFIEKPDAEELKNWVSDTGEEMKQQERNYLASMGIYLFNREAIEKLLFENDGIDFGKNIIPASIKDYNVSSYQYEGYWEDIGTIRSFFEANIDLSADMPKFNLYNTENPIYTNPRMLPPGKVSGTKLDKVVLSEGAIVQAKSITSSLVGIRTRIGKGTVINKTYIMGSDSYESLEELKKNKEAGIPAIGIGNNCNICNAIIDKNVRIGNNVNICGNMDLEDIDTPEYRVVDGIIVVKKGAVLPDGFTL